MGLLENVAYFNQYSREAKNRVARALGLYNPSTWDSIEFNIVGLNHVEAVCKKKFDISRAHAEIVEEIHRGSR